MQINNNEKQKNLTYQGLTSEKIVYNLKPIEINGKLLVKKNDITLSKDFIK